MGDRWLRRPARLAVLALIGVVGCSPTASGSPSPAGSTGSAAPPTSSAPPIPSPATLPPSATPGSPVGRLWAPLPEAEVLRGTFVGGLFFEPPGPLLAGGYYVKGEGRTEGAIWASADGLAWTRLTGPAGFEDAAVGRISRSSDGTFLAVGSTCYYECGGVRIWRSTNGIAWTAVQHDLPDSAFVSVIPGGPGWVGLGEVNLPLGSLAGWTSADGVRWSAATGFGPDAGVIRGIVPTAGGFVAGGSVYPEDRSEPAIWTSADGTSWARLAANAPEGLGLEALVDLDELLIAFARTEDGIEIWTSESGELWALQPGSGDSFAIGGSRLIRIAMVIDGGPGLVAFGAAETPPDGGPTIGVWTSGDGITWQPGDVSAFPPEAEVYDAVTFGEGMLAVGRLPCDIETCVERPSFWISPPR